MPVSGGPLAAFRPEEVDGGGYRQFAIRRKLCRNFLMLP